MVVMDTVRLGGHRVRLSEVVLFAIDENKNEISSMGFLNSVTLLPSEPLELWHWSRGYMAYIHRYSSILRLDLL